MSYVNPRYHGRLVLVPRVRNAFAEIYVSQKPRGAIENLLAASEPSRTLYQLNEFGAQEGEGDLFNFRSFSIGMADPGSKRIRTC